MSAPCPACGDPMPYLCHGPDYCDQPTGGGNRMTLTEFLLARIAEDEAAAKAVAPLGYSFDMGGNRNGERWYVSRLRFSSMDGGARSEQDVEASQLFTRYDPARVLAECEAKRRIVGFAQHAQNLRDEFADPVRPESGYAFGQWSGCRVILGHLALPYADHPDYREEWRP